jgi:hypothetical protein
MNTYYAVAIYTYDNGRVKVFGPMMRELRAKPENSCSELSRLDTYHDWFDTQEEAAAFAAEM